MIGAQLVHAAGESATGHLPVGTIAVVLGAKSVAQLEHIERKLRRLEIPHRAIREPDAPYNHELTAIGIVPVTNRESVKKVTGALKLLGYFNSRQPETVARSEYHKERKTRT